MALQALNDLLAHKNPRFICKSAGASNSSETFTASIAHDISGALTKHQIKELEKDIGEQKQLFAFYSEYGSARLYCDTLSNDFAFYIAHPDEWGELFNGFQTWVDELGEDEVEELIPSWIDDAVVIGEIPSSGNYYLYQIKGEQQGKVFEFEHDGFEFIEIGKDFNGFLNYLCTVTDKLIENIMSHTRYADGKTNTQWLAQAYRYDEH